MHYCIHVFTKEFPTMGMLNDIMDPYNEEEFYRLAYDEDGNERGDIERPDILWDYWVIGGRYGGKLHLKYNYDADDEYEWKYYSFKKGPRNGRLFHCSLLYRLAESHSQISHPEEDYFCYIGGDGYLNVDGAKLKDIINIDDISCYGYIDTDGKVHTQERFDYDKREFIENPSFYTDYHRCKMQCMSDRGYVTVLDIHE